MQYMEARRSSACYNPRTWEMEEFKIFDYIVSSKSAQSPCDLNSFVFVSVWFVLSKTNQTETKIKQNKNLSPVCWRIGHC